MWLRADYGRQLKFVLAVSSAADARRDGLDGGHGRTILCNPPYTGRQVWNRQRTGTELADPDNVTLGHRSVQRWNLPDGRVISSRPAHPALVSEADFIAAQNVNAARGPATFYDHAEVVPEFLRPH